MPTSEQDVSMRDLLASCAAANAVSTPPRAEDEAASDDGADAAAPDEDAVSSDAA
ncbi:hypothetical protein ACIRNI_08680 [Streptomyces sp. NPDC093546]|uniref:hypothetical protein n=1 Tax=Streptomyces sp. NPDC093546 TaxID=3366040 RepID=UPI0038254812